MTRTLARFLSEDDGQDLIEYALIAALISLISVVAIASVGTALETRYQGMATDIAGS